MRRWICLAVFLLPALAQEPVRYQLRFPNAVHHEAQIRATFSPVRQPVLEVLMSRSSPGRYALAEFAKNVYNFSASDGQGHPLAVSQPSPYQWNVSGHKGTVVVEYTLFGDRADGTYAGIDATHAHLNPPAALVWAHGFEKVARGDPVRNAARLRLESGHPDGRAPRWRLDRAQHGPHDG